MSNSNSKSSPILMYIALVFLMAIGGFSIYHFAIKKHSVKQLKCYLKSGDSRSGCFDPTDEPTKAP